MNLFFFYLILCSGDSHRTTDIKPEMLSGIQTGNGTLHDKYNILGIAHACANRRRLGQKFIYVYWSGGKGHVH